MPEPVDFRIGRISDLRLPEGANLAFTFSFSGITFSGHTATLTARRGAGGGRVPFTWSKSGLSVGASSIAFDYPQTTTDDNSKALSTVCSTGATDYALTIRTSGGAIAMRLQGSIEWVEEVGDFGDGSTGSTSLSVSVDTGTAVTVTITGTGHDAVTIAASAADVLSVSGQAITADDAGSDKLVFWDDSESKLTHATIGSGLTMTGTTLTVDAQTVTLTTNTATSGLSGILKSASNTLEPATDGTDYLSPTYLAEQTLTDAATITYDASLGVNAKVTLGGDRTLSIPTNATVGHSGTLQIVQDNVGGRVLTLASGWGLTTGNLASVASMTANKKALLSWRCTESGEFISTLIFRP